MQPDNQPSYIACCPWCGPGTALTLRSDGMGGESLWCTACLAKGPTVAISGDFEQVDAAAIKRWATRAPRVASDVIQRIERSLQIDAMLAYATDDDHRPINIRRSDLLHVVGAAIR